MRARYEYEFVEVPSRTGRDRTAIQDIIRSRADGGWRLVQISDVSKRTVEIIFERPVHHDIDSDFTAVPI